MSMPIYVGTRPKPELARAVMEFDPSRQRFIGAQVARPIPSARKEGTMTLLQREDFTRSEDTEVAEGATYPRGHVRMEPLEFICRKYGQEAQVTEEDYANYRDLFDAERIATLRAWGAVLLHREIRVKTLLFSTATWTGTSLYTDVSSAPWDTAASAVIKPVGDAKEKVRLNTGITPNALVLGASQFQNLLNNTEIKARFPGAAIVTEEMIRNNLAAIFGLKYLLVGGAVYNTAKEGQAFAGGDVWGDDYAMVCKIAETEDPAEPCVMRQIIWSGMMGMSENNVDVKIYTEDQTDSNVVKVRSYQTEKVLDAYLGHLLKID